MRSRRGLLHKDKLAQFTDFVQTKGYVVMPPTGHPYEVLRIRKYDPSGDTPDLTFYKRDRSDHITVPAEASLLEAAYLARYGNRRVRTPRPA